MIDVDGYFAPAASGPASLIAVRFGAVSRAGHAPNHRHVQWDPPGQCAAEWLPGTKRQAYVLNATVVPLHGQPLGYLTLWPDTEGRPVVATLNALDGAITSNMAIVPTLNGSIDAYATSPTDLGGRHLQLLCADQLALNITTTSLPSATLTYSYNTTLGRERRRCSLRLERNFRQLATRVESGPPSGSSPA